MMKKFILGPIFSFLAIPALAQTNIFPDSSYSNSKDDTSDVYIIPWNTPVSLGYAQRFQ